MDDALVAYNAGRVDGAAGYRDPQIAGDPEVGADYRIGLLDGRVAAYHLISEVRRILGVTGSLFAEPDEPWQRAVAEPDEPWQRTVAEPDEPR
ncbi:hypothetical protein Ate01nite_47100 [Actinoplanes teichomyceticus]|uniref:hypothetical protein n=1 Tax=Actinoplanes teichomyceticus TaxID=1867 RepID=UPI0019409034|nr:hypothetical protein [Actinoplanes teichomyceticus]GIF14678.1 hypothetical protein Ate01nite_47100 [Actinoplanes teichomyceticus]